MGKFINEKSLSVGYNNAGQEFFDELHKHEPFIHSYFFSLTEDMKSQKFNPEEVLQTLKNTDTYQIPANLLFNIYGAKENCYKFIDSVKDVVNLTAVTVINPEVGRYIKARYPDLTIHLSVRFYDWEHRDTSSTIYVNRDANKIAHLPLMADVIDVINISGRKSYNDLAFIEACRSYGIKTKFIVNEGCITRKSDNYCEFPGFQDATCNGSPCGRVCDLVEEQYPWVGLTRAMLFKESVKYYNYDILKISTRCVGMNNVKSLLDYWSYEDPTTSIQGIDLNERNYKIFLEYVEARSKCSNHCWNCQLCKSFYNRMI